MASPDSVGFAGLVGRLRAAGANAARFGSPDLVGQLAQAAHRTVDTVILNLLDDDPAFPHQRRVAGVWCGRVIHGLAVLAGGDPKRRAVIAADSAQSREPWMRRLLESGTAAIRDGRLAVAAVRGDYPQAHPSLLLRSALGLRLRPRRSPVERGVIVVDAAAALLVSLMIEGDTAAVPLGVCETEGNEPVLVWVSPPCTLADAVQASGVDAAGMKFLLGAGARRVVASLDQPVGNGELLVHPVRSGPSSVSRACIRCGWCIEACPTGVAPASLLEAAQNGDRGLADRGGVDGCIDCGLCEGVCPSHLPLLAAIRSLTTP